ncbi:MAG: hypothetical protein FWE24_07800 [Defluviitaleaceae bacterium]|nr:hypothetical protein [Defluviitaleaceae bacterium]
MIESIVQNNAAFVIKQISNNLPEPPVKKTLHKMIYLIQKSGVYLGYDYHLYFYGPYSAELDSDVTNLVANGIIEMKYTEYGHRLVPDKESAVSLSEEVDEVDEERVKNIINHYIGKEKSWTAKRLELLATAVYAYEHGSGKDEQSILAGVKRIKGEKYTDSEILEVLSEFDFLGLAIEKVV